MTAGLDITESAEPSATSRPSAITATQSEMCRTTCMSCSTNSTVIPSSRRLWTWPSNDWVSAGFTPAIGSSSMIIVGSLISALAISSSLRWPPDRLPAKSSFFSSRLNRSSSSMAFASISVSCRLHIGLNMDLRRFSPACCCAPSIMLSRTVIRLSALVSWKVRTMPERATLEAEVLSRTLPSKDQWAPFPADVGLSKPVIKLKNVVLPAPFGPIRAVMMPRWTSMWSTLTAVMPPNRRTMVLTTRIGSGFSEPGVASTSDINRRRASGSAMDGLVVCSGIELQLPLVAEDALWSEDHDQHQDHAHHDVRERLCLRGAHDAVGHVGVGDGLHEDPGRVEDDRAEDRAEDRRRSPDQQRGVAEERHRAAQGVGLHRAGKDVDHPAQGTQ